MKENDVLFSVPKIRYFSTRYNEISVTEAHFTEINKEKTLRNSEKTLDYMGR